MKKGLGWVEEIAGGVTRQMLISVLLSTHAHARALTNAGLSATAALVSRCGTATPDRLLRVTASDVAVESGGSIASARSQLALLSAELGSMEVSQKGHLVYAFPRDVLRRARRRESQQPLAQAETAGKACIGLMLLASVCALRPLLARGSGHAQRVSLRHEFRALRHAVVGEQRLTGGGPFDAGGEGARAGGEGAEAASDGEARQLEQSLALACFAFMFGDGRARVAAQRREAQLAAVARCIRASRGAVCAAQLRPFLLDPPRASVRGSRSGGSSWGAESASSWLTEVEPSLLPILLRFDGRPVATDEGEVVYCFPDLLATAGRDASYGLYPTTAPVVRGAGSVLRRLSGPSADRSDYWEEGVRPFATGASAALQRKVYAVACANLCAAVVLGGLLGPLQLYLRRGAGGAAALTVVNFVYGGILTNGLAWLLLPAARRVRLFRDNWAARGRNRRRRRLAEQVLAAEAPLPFVPPHGERIARGMRAARRLRARGREHEAARDDVVYTTAKDVLEQAEAHDPSREAWDAELERRTGRLGAA
ncbi:hypothetical protein EMIHUDRAFT_458167 [Emiliania huxleyi CCMP1516]|uniref:Uncharacterized protein n=2 Tax=Emiliania huxleyi TaxID=2903 RepID=A0A0D3JG36_EMIH1|nr:hypothetical protein EMIHUDRAFT_458167 [Emiliania huxleyi CCMP1516]EOD22471.1 hypothetical protein EMIHUDRAFT_458167 [Emiliania huxleyi CCMP1516]|eukprot:XP_005774900.1 hypothetical protein EMIHUDRAFT_458167 [Emiliania huxleyi CCMP1516]